MPQVYAKMFYNISFETELAVFEPKNWRIDFMDFHVISDSSCDISAEQEKTYHIGIVPYYVSFDGETYRKERTEISAEEFHREMAERPGVFPKTSMQTQIDFYDAFLPYAKAGENILYFNLTAKFSSSFQSANLAAESIMEEYPHCKIAVIDSMSATVQEGLLVTEAAKMAQAGFSFQEAIALVEELKHTSRIFFTCADLSYLKHGGRIGNVLQQAAIALKIKPIMFLHSGELQPAGIARSRKKSLQKVINDAQAFFKDKNINDYRICTGYGYDKEEFRQFYEDVAAAMKEIGFEGEIESYQIGSSIGVHTGPTPLGIAVIKKYNA